MPITLAGNNLLLPDQNGQLAKWLDLYLSVNDSNLWPLSLARDSTRNESQGRHATLVGIPRVNWPDPPAPRINVLYWPITGADRWARGIFLCGDETHDAGDMVS